MAATVESWKPSRSSSSPMPAPTVAASAAVVRKATRNGFGIETEPSTTGLSPHGMVMPWSASATVGRAAPAGREATASAAGVAAKKPLRPSAGVTGAARVSFAGESKTAAAAAASLLLVFFFGRDDGLGSTPGTSAGRIATTAARHELLGASTPLKRCRGNRGGGMSEAIRASNCTGVITRCVAPFLRGFRSR